MHTEVLVVIGVGGIGQPIARRQRTGRSVVLADYNEATDLLIDGGVIAALRGGRWTLQM